MKAASGPLPLTAVPAVDDALATACAGLGDVVARPLADVQRAGPRGFQAGCSCSVGAE